MNTLPHAVRSAPIDLQAIQIHRLRSKPASRIGSISLLLLAAVISARLGWGAWQGAGGAGCIATGCAEVAGTAHAWALALPVGFWGALAYLAAAGALALGWRRVFPLLAGGIVAAALWFTALQAWVIGAWCAGCITVHALALAAVALGWVSSRPAVEGGRHSRLLLAGLVAGLPLLAGLPAWKPVASVTEVAAGGVPGLTLAGDRIALFGGEASFARGDFPLYGDPQAGRVAVLLWSPACHHCRAMQPLLRDAGERLAAEGLAIVSIPSSVPGPGAEWARLLHLAWQADPAQYAALAAGLAAPAAATAMQAGPQVAREWFARRLGKDWENHGPQADSRHDQASSLLAAAWRHYGQPVVPLMIRSGGVSAGALFSVDDLVKAAKDRQSHPTGPPPAAPPFLAGTEPATGSSEDSPIAHSPPVEDSPPFVPTLEKVMTYSEIIGSEPFGGDVAINAYGKWIACSKQGVFVSTGTANTSWQQVFAPGSDSMVNSNTSKILCRISDSGSWAVLSRAGLYRSSDSNNLEGTLVSSGMGTNNVYDMDMRPNGNWIASASTGTWRFMNGAVAQVLGGGANANGAGSSRRIVRINSSGDWMIMTSNGVYKNMIQVLINSGGVNIGGNVNYWSLDFNESADWVMINGKGTFLNGVRITSPVIQVLDVGEMHVQITNRNTGDTFDWMAISPSGIYKNAVLQTVPVFIANKTQYTLDMNNNGDWIAGGEGGILLNGNIVYRTGTTIQIQSNNGVDNEIICELNDFSDYICLTANGIFRNARDTVGAESALSQTYLSPNSFKHVLDLGANGSVVALIENLMATTTTGVYTGSYVLEPVPPAPAAATLNGFTLSWSNSGGTTLGFRVAVSTPQAQGANSGGTTTTSCSGGSELYSGTNETFTITDFTNFEYGLNYITLCALNTSGGYSEPIVFEYTTAPFQILAQSIDFNSKTITMSWNSLPGKSYTIQKSTNLQTWEDLEFVNSPNPSASAITAETGQWVMTRTASDPLMGTPQQPRAFYRVKSTP